MKDECIAKCCEINGNCNLWFAITRCQFAMGLKGVRAGNLFLMFSIGNIFGVKTIKHIGYGAASGGMFFCRVRVSRLWWVGGYFT